MISSITWTIGLLLHEIKLLLYYQQEEYDFIRFWKWFSPKIFTILPPSFFIISLLGILVLAIRDFFNFAQLFSVTIFIIMGGCFVVIFARELKEPTKKKISYTLRIKRMILVLLILNIIAFVYSPNKIGAFAPHNGVLFPYTMLIIWGLLFLVAPVLFLLASTLLYPFEVFIQKVYLLYAARKMKKIKPIVVGITGSYGKTSTKYILTHLLSGQKKVLATPKSYNTLMGISKAINTSLEKKHEIFIVEMGAYKIGEIKQICKLVQPQLATITAIGPQHLERFGSLDKIVEAKYEIISSLSPGGKAIFNADDPNTELYIKRTKNNKIILISSSNKSKADLCVDQMSGTSRGFVFEIIDNKTDRKYYCTTSLLGRHNVTNIMIALAIAIELKVDIAHAIEKIKSLKPIPHRLQLVKTSEGVNILDDAYNSNPLGAKNALDTLAFFEDGKKILVTPGLIELGQSEELENHRIGNYAAKICDLVLLVGEDETKRIKYIFQGLVDNGMDTDKIIIIPTINEAFTFLNECTSYGDTVLLLNDLPDTFSN